MILAILMMLFTLIVLVAGTILMASGGKLNKKYGNKLMRARIIFQLLAVVILGIIFIFAK